MRLFNAKPKSKAKSKSKSKQTKVKKFSPVSRNKFSFKKLGIFAAVFAVIGVVVILRTFAATTSVTYSGRLTATNQRATYTLTTGAGTINTTLNSNSKDLNLFIKNSSGGIIKTVSNNGSRTATGNLTVSAGTYTFEVSYGGILTGKTKKDFDITISYPLSDSTSPTAVITNPSSAATVTGTVSYAATATDDTGISKVEFFVNSSLLATDTSAPYSTSWNTTTVANGENLLYVKSYDTAGNIGEASSVVVVNNSTTPTPTPDPAPTGSCAVATSHVPDGPDGLGGCWPGPSNTGVPAGVTLAPYTSPCTITVANTVIDSKDIQCDSLVINANNVTISRSKIKHYVQGQEKLGYAFTISDSEIDGALANYGGVACVNCGVDGYDFTILRTEIKHTNRSAYCMNKCNIKDSWFHGVNLDTSPCPQASSGTCPHASAFRAEQYATVTHNSLACDFTGPFNYDLGCSADMSGYPDFKPIHHNTIDSNLFMSNNVGTSFCAYGGGTAGKDYSSDPLNATYVVFKNNVFQGGSNGKCGAFGPVTDFITGKTGNVWTNNKFDNGSVVNPG